MAWVLPASPSTGQVVASAWGDDVAGDLAVLQTQVGLYAVGAAASGSSPATTAPNFLMQAGIANATFVSGFVPFSFPTAFPNGLQSFVLTPVNNSASNQLFIQFYSPSASGVELTGEFAGTPYSGLLQFCYIAIGF